jgi:hypothetical protein
MRHARHLTVGCVFLLFLALGCEDDREDTANPDASAAEPATADQREPEGSELPFQQVGLYYMLNHQETVIVRNQTAWNTYLARASQYFFDPSVDPTDPHCDFAESMLVAHSFGPISGCGFNGIDVTAVTADSSKIVVSVSVDDADTPPHYDADGNVLTCDAIMHFGFAVAIPQSGLPVQVAASYY